MRAICTRVLFEFDKVIHNRTHGSRRHNPRGWERRAGSCCGRRLLPAKSFSHDSSSEEKAASVVDQAIAASSTASQSGARLPDCLDGSGNPRFDRGHLRTYRTARFPAVLSLQAPVSDDSAGYVCVGQAGRSDSDCCGQLEAQKLHAGPPMVPRRGRRSGETNRIHLEIAGLARHEVACSGRSLPAPLNRNSERL